jgi:transketolase
MAANDQEALKAIRRQILEMVFRAKEGHVPSAFSILEILYVLYKSALRYDAQNPKWEGRDRFVLSKGHAGAGLYAILAEFGFFKREILNTYCQPGSILGGHPDSKKVPGVEVSTGSLGHGIAVGAGMAAALNLSKSEAKVVCLVGDGEMDEGSFWETVMFARNANLNNLVVIADCNRSQKYSHGFNYAKILNSFGWDSTEVEGHNIEALTSLLVPAVREKRQNPLFITAHTTKGYGVQRFIGEHGWHRRTPTQAELDELFLELA